MNDFCEVTVIYYTTGNLLYKICVIPVWKCVQFKDLAILAMLTHRGTESDSSGDVTSSGGISVPVGARLGAAPVRGWCYQHGSADGEGDPYVYN